jgi:hypothetical protein
MRYCDESTKNDGERLEAGTNCTGAFHPAGWKESDRRAPGTPKLKRREPGNDGKGQLLQGRGAAVLTRQLVAADFADHVLHLANHQLRPQDLDVMRTPSRDDSPASRRSLLELCPRRILGCCRSLECRQSEPGFQYLVDVFAAPELAVMATEANWGVSLPARRLSIVEVNSCFRWWLNSPLAWAANPEWISLTRPSRAMNRVAGQVLRLTACGTFFDISLGAPAMR